jgi:hypothetical protein
MLDTLFWISLWSVIAGTCCLAIWLGMNAWEKIRSKRAMLHLKGMNRGVMDGPDWVKQQWQHDAGECTRRALAISGQIEEFANGRSIGKLS